MAWNAHIIRGLVGVNNTVFHDSSEYIALSGMGQPGDPVVAAAFSYDDTLWGALPAGVFPTIASCAVNAPGRTFSAPYVQIGFSPVGGLGLDLVPGGSPSASGSITALSVSMGGMVVEVCDDGASAAVAAAVGMADVLPWSVPPQTHLPFLYLTRAVSLAWPGQDPTNEANRTIWRIGEVKSVAWQFTVSSYSVVVVRTFNAYGWDVG